jgi:hypothetical protein
MTNREEEKRRTVEKDNRERNGAGTLSSDQYGTHKHTFIFMRRAFYRLAARKFIDAQTSKPQLATPI